MASLDASITGVPVTPSGEMQLSLPLAHALVAHRLVFGRTRLDLGAVERRVPELHQPGPLAQFEHLHEQRRERSKNNQSGIVLPNDDGIERFSDQEANRADADVPGNVTLAFGLGKAELSKPPRKMLPRVIGDDEERRFAVFVVYRERRRLVSRQKTTRRLIHLRPALTKGRH
jgi:hypothetical protein